MKNEKRWWEQWWNPIAWLAEITRTVLSVINGILGFFGIRLPQPAAQWEAIRPDDVKAAYEAAAAAETRPQTLEPSVDAKVAAFQRYVDAPTEDRPAVDLSVFSVDEQDFVLGLSEADLKKLQAEGQFGAMAAIILCRVPEQKTDHSPKTETAPELPEPSHAELIRERFLHFVRRRPEEAAPDSDFTPQLAI